MAGQHKARPEAGDGGIDVDRKRRVFDRLLLDVPTEAARRQRGDGEPVEVADVGLEADQLPVLARGLEGVEGDLHIHPLADRKTLHHTGHGMVHPEMIGQPLAHATRRRR